MAAPLVCYSFVHLKPKVIEELIWVTPILEAENVQENAIQDIHSGTHNNGCNELYLRVGDF